jgi:hypothetical protein
MKRFSFATLAALAIVMVSHEQAKAWFNWSLGGSANTNISWGGLKGSWNYEPWPTNAYGLPQYNFYGPSNSGPPSYPVNPYGMYTYGATNGRPPAGAPVPPAPPSPTPAPTGAGAGSGVPMGYNYQPQPYGYGNYNPSYYYPQMPYAQPAQYQPSVYPPASSANIPAYWYGR